jgi:hypothetical protein
MQHYQFFETLTFDKTQDYTNHVPEISTLLIPNHTDHAHLKTLLYNLDPSNSKAPLDAFNTRLRLPRPDSAQVLDIIKFIEKQEDDFRKPVAPLLQNQTLPPQPTQEQIFLIQKHREEAPVPQTSSVKITLVKPPQPQK